MSKKWLIAIPLILILLVLCAAIVVVGLFSYSTARVEGVSLFRGDLNFAAQETEEKTYAVSGPATLAVDNFTGQIRVVKGTDGKIVVESVKEARGISQQDAQNALKKVTINTVQTGDALDIRVVLEKGTINWSGKVDFVIRVPE